MFPLGVRGARPVAYNLAGVPLDRIDAAKRIVGVKFVRNQATIAWDGAGPLARTLGLPVPTVPRPGFADTYMPGLERYRELGLPQALRVYQKEAVEFLIHRSWALLADPMRSGKSLAALAAATLVGCEKVLIITPAVARLGWAEEVARWLKVSPLLLYGRAVDEARWSCATCLGHGHVGGVKCMTCKPVRVKGGALRGQRIVSATSFKPEMMKATGPGWWPSCVWPYAPTPTRCAKHKLDAPPAGIWRCQPCTEALDAALDEAQVVICNYDLLIAQGASTGTGQTFVRSDLPGWAERLSRIAWDLIIGDELHYLRGRQLGWKRKKDGRREATMLVGRRVPRFWGLTGTPMFGFVRDLWGQLNILSGGLFGAKPFDFDIAFCEGHRGEYGWEADGASPLAETELVERLSVVMMKRPRSVILAEQPPKNRSFKRIEADKKLKHTKRRSVMTAAGDGAAGAVSASRAAMAETFAIKLPHVIDALCAEMAEGNKAVVYVYNVANVALLGQGIQDAIDKGEARVRLRQTRASVWAVSGLESGDARQIAARTFREHTGAGVFVASVESMQTGISLRGASSVHYVDLHWVPSVLLQSEDRPYEVGCHVDVIYYVVRGSIDEHIEQVVLPRLEALAKTMAESEAASMVSAFRSDSGLEAETLEQIWARLTASVADDVDEVDDLRVD